MNLVTGLEGKLEQWESAPIDMTTEEHEATLKAAVAAARHELEQQFSIQQEVIIH